MQRRAKLKISYVLSIVQAILVRYIRVDDEWVERARAASAKGALVFVLRNRSLIDFLCLRGLCRKHGLPEVSFVSGLAAIMYSPILRWIASFFRPRRLNPMKDALLSSGSAVVFLRRPAAEGALDSRPVSVDGIRMAVESQADTDRPIVALPAVFLWGEHPMERLPGTVDFLFGSNEYPRLSRSIWLLIRRRSVHEMMLGEPLNLKEIGAERHLHEEALAGVIRAGVGRQIETMRRMRLGSLTKPSSRIKKEVLSSPRLRGELETIAKDEGIPTKDIHPKAKAIIQKLAADFNPKVVAIFALALKIVWRQLYTGIDIRKLDVERMRKVITRGPSLILPSHRSHIDYLVLSQVMRMNNLILPHIVAGQNLMFWPMGWIFRSSGAFFIRRQFDKARFYIAVVGAYVRRLIQERNAIEVFIEGGRSRTGKLIRPKSGLLEMALRGIAATPREDLYIMPVYIGYERVIEEKTYVKESKGIRKKAESLTGLLKSTRVLFSRYGRLYVRVGQCFSVQQMLDKEGIDRSDLMTSDICRRFASQIAMRTYREINRKTVITPSAVFATVFLSSPEESISHGLLRRRSLWLVDILDSLGAEQSPVVQKWKSEEAPNPLSHLDDLDRTIRAFYRAGRVLRLKKGQSVFYTAESHHRLTLDYYKNNIIHYLVPASLVCTTCIGADVHDIEFEDLCQSFEISARLYNWEFMLDIFGQAEDTPFRDNIKERVSKAVALLVHHKVLHQSGSRVSVIDRANAYFLSNILLNFHEAYSAVAEVRLSLPTLNGDEIADNASALAEKYLAEGRFTRIEGHTPVSIKYAVRSFQDLNLVPKEIEQDAKASGSDVLEASVYKYLQSAVAISRLKDKFVLSNDVEDLD